jgi:hypothetical protein
MLALLSGRVFTRGAGVASLVAVLSPLTPHNASGLLVCIQRTEPPVFPLPAGRMQSYILVCSHSQGLHRKRVMLKKLGFLCFVSASSRRETASCGKLDDISSAPRA